MYDTPVHDVDLNGFYEYEYYVFKELTVHPSMSVFKGKRGSCLDSVVLFFLPSLSRLSNPLNWRPVSKPIAMDSCDVTPDLFDPMLAVRKAGDLDVNWVPLHPTAGVIGASGVTVGKLIATNPPVSRSVLSEVPVTV